jgi:hypothetical protein
MSPQVLAVSPPVWLQRGDSTTPLRAGANLQQTDVITVGSTGGAVIRIDQARLALQEKTTWLFPEDSNNDAASRSAGILLEGSATIDASVALPGSASMRLTLFDLSYKPAMIEAGAVAGALVSKREATICLAKGKATFDDATLIGHTEHRHLLAANPGQTAVTEKPSECYSLAAGGAEGLWITQDGRWQVNLRSDRDAEVAQGLFTHLRNNGYPVEIASVFVGGKDYQRIYMRGFASQAAAAAMASQLRGRLPGVDKPWVLASTPPEQTAGPAAPLSAPSATPQTTPKVAPRSQKRIAIKKNILRKKTKAATKPRAKE